MIKITSLLLVLIFLIGCNDVDFSSQKKFPNNNFTNVIAYQYIVKNKNDYNLKEEGKTLSKEQVNTLLDIINDPTSFDDRLGLRCFQPDLKFIFYNQNNHPISNLEISFECNQISSFPKLNYQSFSIDGYNRIMDGLLIL